MFSGLVGKKIQVKESALQVCWTNLATIMDKKFENLLSIPPNKFNHCTNCCMQYAVYQL